MEPASTSNTNNANLSEDDGKPVDGRLEEPFGNLRQELEPGNQQQEQHRDEMKTSALETTQDTGSSSPSESQCHGLSHSQSLSSSPSQPVTVPQAPPPLSHRVLSSHSLIGLGMLPHDYLFDPSMLTVMTAEQVHEDSEFGVGGGGAGETTNYFLSASALSIDDDCEGTSPGRGTDIVSRTNPSRFDSYSSASFEDHNQSDGNINFQSGHGEEIRTPGPAVGTDSNAIGTDINVEVSPFTPTSREGHDDEEEEEEDILNDVVRNANGDDCHLDLDAQTTTTPPPTNSQKLPQSLSPPLLTNYSSNKSEADAGIVVSTTTNNNDYVGAGGNRSVASYHTSHSHHPLPAISSLPLPSPSSSLSKLQHIKERHGVPQQPQLDQLISSNSSTGSLPSVVFPPSGMNEGHRSGTDGGGGGGGGGVGNTSRGQQNIMYIPLTKSRPPRAPHNHASSPTRMTKPRSSSSGASIGAGGGGGGPVSEKPTEKKHTQQNQSAKSHNHRHHRRTNTDSSNFSLVSALTDASGDFVAPRRRTLSWDLDETQNNKAGKDGTSGQNTVGHAETQRSAGNTDVMQSHGGIVSIPGNVLQPILFENMENPPNQYERKKPPSTTDLPDSIIAVDGNDDKANTNVSSSTDCIVPPVSKEETGKLTLATTTPAQPPTKDESPTDACMKTPEAGEAKLLHQGSENHPKIKVRYNLSHLLDTTKESSEETELLKCIERARLHLNSSSIDYRVVLRYHTELDMLMKKLQLIGEVSSNDEKCNLNEPDRMKHEVSRMLEECEHPVVQTEENSVAQADVFRFRRALDSIDKNYPFAALFGKATTREEAIESSQNVFESLARSECDTLQFEVLCQTAMRSDGSMDKAKIRNIIKMFRPSRNGQITKLEFMKSIDDVYKNLQMLVANINNSSQLDHEYERIVKYFVYTMGLCLALATLGFDAKPIITAITGALVSFAFVIGTAGSNYLQGVIFILFCRPYDIGDRVCFHLTSDSMDNDGPSSGGYIVEKINLSSTTVRLASSRGQITFSNGKLASAKIVNFRRSEMANVSIYLKFNVITTRSQIQIFKQRLLEHLKDRPREWIKLCSFRCIRAETNKQYMEYVIIAQHCESWQNFVAVEESKGDLFLFALQLQRDLNMACTARDIEECQAELMNKL